MEGIVTNDSFWVGRGPGDKDAIVTTLLEILASATDADTESAVASALTEVGTPRALAALSEMARDRNRSVNARRSALNAIARNENPSQLTMLDDLYKNGSGSVEMRRSVTTAIGRIADPRVIPVLANIARTDADIYVRRTAIQALGRRKEPEAIKALEDLLKDAPVPRVQLNEIGPHQFDFNFDFDEANIRDFEEQIRRAEEEAAEMVRRFYFKE
jgi:HEAT repeat protein